MPRICHVVVALCSLVAAGLSGRPASAVDQAAAISFEAQVRPIFKAYCFRCHGGEDELKGGLDLRLRRFMAAGGESGAAIEPGHADKSLLYQRIRDGEMPPDERKLTPADVEVIGRWIDAGAPTARTEPEKLDPGVEITPEERAFWAFQPLPRQVAVPAVGNDARVQTPIDAFLLSSLANAGLTFSVPAPKATLLARASFDLIGLPPTGEELEQFVNDPDPQAYERAVDRLLASPHYGERWGRYWLDVAGYADSDGYTAADTPRPFAYKYRDYVIRALNADLPLDQFIADQLAGDELSPAELKNLSPPEVDRLAATGFLRMAADGTATGGVDLDVARNQVMADTIKIVSTSLLGLSIGCAQCHDHRYDPIPQGDYYRLRAVFEPAYNWKAWRTPGERLVSLWTDKERAAAAEVDAEVAKASAERQAKLTAYMDEALEKELARFDEPQREALRVAYRAEAGTRTPEQKQALSERPSLGNLTAGTLYQYNPAAAEDLKKLDAAIAAVAAKKPFQDFIPVLTEVPGQLPPTLLFHRGDHRQPKNEIAPGGLTVCAPPGERLQIAAKDPTRPSSGRRLALAQWIASEQNPLTARVLVNRVWLHHFGRGLVNTPGDFGSLGEKPSHPELLDWLARDLVAGGWRLKRLHKLIMTSTAYQQASNTSERGLEVDPENRLVWRMQVRRLDAEAVRDRILATTGALNRKMYGPSIPVKEDTVGQVVVGVDLPEKQTEPPLGHEAFRRSIYIQVRRSQPLAMLHAFDQPVMETNCERRTLSTVATQSLMLMNSDFVVQQSNYLAARVRKVTPGDAAERIQAAWKLAFGRTAQPAEVERATRFLADQTVQPAGEQAADPLASLCQILLSANEFLYVD
jgi:hypothetical protein